MTAYIELIHASYNNEINNKMTLFVIGVNKNPPAKTLNNLCGDLNKGSLPLNPMKQNVLGSPYPL